MSKHNRERRAKRREDGGRQKVHEGVDYARLFQHAIGDVANEIRGEQLKKIGDAFREMVQAGGGCTACNSHTRNVGLWYPLPRICKLIDPTPGRMMVCLCHICNDCRERARRDKQYLKLIEASVFADYQGDKRSMLVDTVLAPK